MRSAEAFGILNVDIVNLKEKFKPSTVSKGVEKWLRVRKFNAIASCAADLKSQGYKIVAGLPSQTSKPLYDIAVDRPVAVVFGNEHAGISPEWLPYVDEFFTIPMVGLVESLNISVSAALALHELARKALQDPTIAARYPLTASEMAYLLNEWTCRQVSTWECELEALRKNRV
jgi:tRNA (guanosine-2'-O-)-methyltransferase